MNDLFEICRLIQEEMVMRSKKLSTAESCTGGRISSAITAVSGASDYFEGTLVAYDSLVKERLLGVKHETIVRHDVVSEQVVSEMVVGSCQLFNTDYAIATSGYAGPNGANGIPAGTIWIAYGSINDIRTLCLKEDSGRINNVNNAVKSALIEFYKYIKDL